MSDKPREILVEVEGADQDKALAEAEKLAKKKGYGRASLKNIVKITYEAMLFEPIEK
jgi:hypothetical protein